MKMTSWECLLPLEWDLEMCTLHILEVCKGSDILGEGSVSVMAGWWREHLSKVCLGFLDFENVGREVSREQKSQLRGRGGCVINEVKERRGVELTDFKGLI